LIDKEGREDSYIDYYISNTKNKEMSRGLDGESSHNLNKLRVINNLCRAA